MSWEQQKKLQLVIGILHKEVVDINILYAALRLERPGWRSLILFESGRPYDIARNNVATRCLESGAEWCFFLDSDIMIPHDAILKLVNHNLPIVSGVYYRRHPEIWPEVFRDVNGVLTPIPKHQLPDGVVFEVDGVGMGCCAIHRRVFEVLKQEGAPLRTYRVAGPPPGEIKYYDFFSWTIGREPNPEEPHQYSEDLTFCKRVKKAGFKIHVDPTVKCGHIAPMMIKDGIVTWTPLESGIE